MVFPAVMDGCESWTIEKAEYQRSDTFELWCWRRLENPLDNKKIKPVQTVLSGTQEIKKKGLFSFLLVSIARGTYPN